jgi:phosphatidylinositol alpha 1,6-mannosyltransferase
VDTARFAPQHRDAGLRDELAPNGELLVGYVGRLAPEKRIERLAALGRMPGVRLVVVGDGPERQSLTAALPDAAFLGQRTGAELARIYASLDVFVHTGPHETFCQAVQEAMASGLPVVAPDAGGPRDLVTPMHTGLLLPVSQFEARLSESVDHLIAERARYSVAARRSVLNRTWPAVCDQLLGHYDAVMGEARRKAA